GGGRRGVGRGGRGGGGTGRGAARRRPADVHDRRGRGWLGGVASPLEHVSLVEGARPRRPQAVSPVSQRGDGALDTAHTVPPITCVRSRPPCWPGVRRSRVRPGRGCWSEDDRRVRPGTRG